MKACVLTAKNNIEYKEVETPKIKSGEVLVKVRACGICSSDFNRVYKNSAYFFPIILGHEFSGEIVECAPDVDKSYLEKRAVVFPLLPCRECEFCAEKHYAQCKKYSYFGSRQNGAMAEYIAVPIWNIKIMPDDMSFRVGALCEPTAVAVHAVNKINGIEGKELCIIGSGTIGILAGIIAKTKGADVTFSLRNDKKIELLKTLGFEKFLINESKSFDVVLECVGSNSSINNSIELVKSRGLIVFVGNPEGDITLPQKIYWKLLRSEITVQGIWNSSYKSDDGDDWDEAIKFLYKNQNLADKLLTDKFKFSDGIKAFEKMKCGNHISLKGVFENE